LYRFLILSCIASFMEDFPFLLRIDADRGNYGSW
jgi:hypothetical protein